MVCKSRREHSQRKISIYHSKVRLLVTSVSQTLLLSAFFSVGCCVLAFCIGLLFVQRSGNYFVAMFDDYSATLPLLIVVLLENIAVAWVYGTDKYVTHASSIRELTAPSGDMSVILLWRLFVFNPNWIQFMITYQPKKIEILIKLSLRYYKNPMDCFRTQSISDWIILIETQRKSKRFLERNTFYLDFIL